MTVHRLFSSGSVSLLFSMVALLMTSSVIVHADDGSAQHQIREVISTAYDKPDHKVETSPIAVADDYAVADWTQGNRGGRALLRRIDGKWTISACGADELKKVSTLTDAGIPAKTATSIVDQLTTAEQAVSPERLKRFSLFGTMNDPVMAEHHQHHKDQ